MRATSARVLLRACVGARQRALERVLEVAGDDRRAVLVDEAGAQVERVDEAVGRQLPALGEPRYERERLVVVKERVEQRVERVAGRLVVADDRIERADLLLDRDA